MTETMVSREGTAEIDVRFAVPDDADNIAELYDRVYDGWYPILDCVDPLRIRRLLASGEHIWVIGLDNGVVVASSLLQAERANSAYEFGRAAVLRQYIGRGHFLKISDYMLVTARNRMDSDLIYGFARGERSRMLYSHGFDQY